MIAPSFTFQKYAAKRQGEEQFNIYVSLAKNENIENIVPVNVFKVSKDFRKTSEAFFLVEIEVVQLHSLA